ncbi:hypothetical protein [Streptomyces sp. NPDC002547]
MRVGPLEPVGPEDLLVVYDYHQARLHRQFKPNQVISIHASYKLRGWQPKRAFHTGLGLSRQADRMRAELRRLEVKYGTTVHHVSELYMYDEGGIAHPDTPIRMYLNEEVPAP